MIYETPNGEIWPIEEVARNAVQEKCDKFRYQNCIYAINFAYRKIETVSMTEKEAERQFGNK
jgi:hypothetical protein